jgi:hypothetical protein
MGSKTVYYTLETDQPLDLVTEAAGRALTMVGGTIVPIAGGYEITQGVNGVNFAFTADFKAYVQVRAIDQRRYEVIANINWSPNAVFWVCLVVGVCVVGLLWIVSLLYFFIDPSSTYQQALYSIPNYLPREQPKPRFDPDTGQALPPG